MNKIFASFLFLMVAMGFMSFAPKTYAETPVEAPEGETPTEGDEQTRIPDNCPNCGMG